MYMTDISNENIVSKTSSGKKIYWMLASEIGAPNFELRYIEIPPNVQGRDLAGAILGRGANDARAAYLADVFPCHQRYGHEFAQKHP